MTTTSLDLHTRVVGCGLFAAALLLSGAPASADPPDQQPAPAKSASRDSTGEQVSAPVRPPAPRGDEGAPESAPSDVGCGTPMDPMARREEEPEDKRKPRLLISGFTMLDTIYDFQRVNSDWIGAFRPSKLPTTTNLPDGEVAFSVRQSKLAFQGFTPTAMGDLNARFEFDLYGVGPDAGQTTMRIRHIYGEMGRFLAGQTNSTFMDGDVFPNVIDYWGPNGMVFVRVPQLRYTPIRSNGRTLHVSIEAPNSAVDAGNANEIDPSLLVQGRNQAPDVAVQWRQDGSFGHYALAGILRNMAFESAGSKTGAPSGGETGGGLSLSGALKVLKRDKVYAQLTYGWGISSYMNDGGVDLAGDGEGNAEPVPSLGFQLYYEHPWNSRWTSSIGYSEHSQNNTGGQLGDAYHRGQYFSVNLLYSPMPNLMMGIEYLWGHLETNDGQTGRDNRIQMSFKYNFSSH